VECRVERIPAVGITSAVARMNAMCVDGWYVHESTCTKLGEWVIVLHRQVPNRLDHLNG
jgi:hypothetical protein